MLDDKQNGLLRDILDSATAITRYLDGVSRENFFSNTEKQECRSSSLGNHRGSRQPHCA